MRHYVDFRSDLWFNSKGSGFERKGMVMLTCVVRLVGAWWGRIC